VRFGSPLRRTTVPVFDTEGKISRTSSQNAHARRPSGELVPRVPPTRARDLLAGAVVLLWVVVQATGFIERRYDASVSAA